MSWEEDLWGAISKKSQKYGGGGQLGRVAKIFRQDAQPHRPYFVQSDKMKKIFKNLLQFTSRCDIIISTGRENAPTN